MPPSILQRFIVNGNESLRFPTVSPVRMRFAQDMDISISMLRLEDIHPQISGNKLFKLHFFLEEALKSTHKTIVTFGGAYSNHLAATAYAAKILGIHCIGIVRGERQPRLSDTLVFCEKSGMKLEFISREEYRQIAPLDENEVLKDKYGDHILIPEGGYSKKGVLGACEIAGFYTPGKYSHICVAIGTATTLAGILTESTKETTILGFPALKGLKDISERLYTLGVKHLQNLSMMEEYHFGGFGKKTSELIAFMNLFYTENKIPLDIVYTGKMMFGVQDLLKNNYFPAGSDILCIHTGGLQGNSSIKELLVY